MSKRHNLIKSVLEMEVYSGESDFEYLFSWDNMSIKKMDCFSLFDGFWLQKYQICLLLNGRSGFHGDQTNLICCFADHAPCTTSTLAGLESGWTQLPWQVCTALYRVSPTFSTPFQQQSPGGDFKDVQLSSHFQVASLVMLFETGTFYMMMINIRHVSQCFFKLSVKLSGNINRCLFFFIVVMPLLQILHRSMVFLTQIDQISIIYWQLALVDIYLVLIQVFILHLIELALCQTLF